jgi:hypothetical protein
VKEERVDALLRCAALREHRREVRGLRVADFFKLLLEHVPRGVAAAFLRLRGEVCAERGRAGFCHRLAQLADAFLHDACVLSAAVGLAVALEPAPLDEVEQHAAEFVRGERLGERLHTERVGITEVVAELRAVRARVEQLRREQAVPDEQAFQFLPPIRAPGSLAAAQPGHPAFFVFRRLSFVVEHLIKDADAGGHDARGHFVGVYLDEGPSDRVRAEVESEQGIHNAVRIPACHQRGQAQICSRCIRPAPVSLFTARTRCKPSPESRSRQAFSPASVRKGGGCLFVASKSPAQSTDASWFSRT